MAENKSGGRKQLKKKKREQKTSQKKKILKIPLINLHFCFSIGSRNTRDGVRRTEIYLASMKHSSENVAQRLQQRGK